MYVIPSKEEVAATITLAPWNQNAELRAKLRDNIEEYWSLVRAALTRAVEDVLQRPSNQ